MIGRYVGPHRHTIADCIEQVLDRASADPDDDAANAARTVAKRLGPAPEPTREALERLIKRAHVVERHHDEGAWRLCRNEPCESARRALAASPGLDVLVTLVRLGFLGHEDESRITADRVKGEPYRAVLHTILSAKDVAEAVARLSVVPISVGSNE